MRVAMYYRTERWSDVVRLLTPVVNDSTLDAAYAHAVRIALGTALARLGMFAPALSYLEEPAGPVDVATVDGTLVKALSLRAQGEDLDAADVLAELYAANPENDAGRDAMSDTSFGIVPDDRRADRSARRPLGSRDRADRSRLRRPRRQGAQGPPADRGRGRARRVHRPRRGQVPGRPAQEFGRDGDPPPGARPDRRQPRQPPGVRRPARHR